MHGKVSNKDFLESRQGKLDKSYGFGLLHMDTKCSREGFANGKGTAQTPASISCLDMTLPMGRNS